MATARVVRAAAAALSAAALLAPPATARAQRRPAYFDEPAQVRVVGEPQPGEALPVLVALPPTGAPAAWFYQYLSPSVPFRAYVLVLPAGAPSRADYGPDFGRFTGWFDARLQTDLARASAQFPVDPARVYLAGFSLGGDLAWALLGRHPDQFRGALVLSSRCSATMSGAALATLRARGARVAFGIGEADDPGRVRGLLAAFRRAQRAGVASVLLRFAGGHRPPGDRSLVESALRTLLE